MATGQLRIVSEDYTNTLHYKDNEVYKVISIIFLEMEIRKSYKTRIKDYLNGHLAITQKITDKCTYHYDFYDLDI